MRGVRPPNAPEDFVEYDCANPVCERTTWVPPGTEEATKAGGSVFMPTCSTACAVELAKVLSEQGPVGYMDVQAPLLPLVIAEMYAFIATDETGEGIPAMPIGKTSMPLVGADWERMQSLRPYAQRLAKMSGKKIKLVKFTNRVELEEFG